MMMVLIIISWNQTGHWQNRIALFNHATDTAPENVYAYLLLGKALRDAGKNSEALNTYTKALRLSPEATIYNKLPRRKLRCIKSASLRCADNMEIMPNYDSSLLQAAGNQI